MINIEQIKARLAETTWYVDVPVIAALVAEVERMREEAAEAAVVNAEMRRIALALTAAEVGRLSRGEAPDA